MRRVVATFDDPEAADEATDTLADAGFEPREPDVANPFFDPATEMPEERGLLWGAVLGGIVGAVLLFALDQHVYWIPRISPIMTAGLYSLVVLGLGVGAAVGGFVGGAIGTVRPAPEPDDPRVAVLAPDHRVDEATDLLEARGATGVDDAAAYHEHPLRSEASGGAADEGAR